MIEDCTALVLVGGKSRRMGQDKANLVIGGDETLLQKVVAIVRPLFAKVVVSVDRERPGMALQQVCDAKPGGGPLAGVCAGLAEAGTPWIFAVATDMPFLRPALIEALAQKRGGGGCADRACEAVIPIVHGHAQTLCGFYASAALPTLQAVLAGGERASLRAALAKLNVCYVEESELRSCDPELSSFFDLDTPEDVARALRERL